jgi:2',3'-cyclic-nucleotide 2'-phosphodiesterase (5'-nucleotidase family)
VLGGLARRVSFVEKTKREGRPVMVVDSGQIFTNAGIVADKKLSLTKAQLISRAYRHMGVAAINIGDSDLMQGIAFLREESSRGLPLISANLLDPSNKTPLFSPYVIKKAGGIRIAYFGLLSPDINTAIRQMAGEKFLVQDPVETARHVIRNLYNKADIIILLSNLDVKREQAVIRAVSGIHFVLGGHDGRYLSSPLWEGQTPVLESYRKGMYAGTLHLTFVKRSSPFKDERTHSTTTMANGNRFLWTLSPLDSSLKEDRDVTLWIRKAGIEKDLDTKNYQIHY